MIATSTTLINDHDRPRLGFGEAQAVLKRQKGRKGLTWVVRGPKHWI